MKFSLKKMYSRLKSSLLNHFHKGNSNSQNGPGVNRLSKEEKKRLRHSLAECQLNDTSYLSSSTSSASSSYDSASFHLHNQSTFSKRSHAPLAPQEEYLDETVYSDLLACSYSSNSTSGVFTASTDYEDSCDAYNMSSGLPALSWNVQYIGSFPVSGSGSNVENLGRRIDMFQPAATMPRQSVELAISVLGVKISCEKTILMSHSLRRVTDISARPATRNVGYVATEPVGRTYRRLCHIFHCQSLKEAEEIENVLRNANQSEVLNSKPLATVSSSTSSMQPVATSAMSEKRSVSTVFLNRILGKKGSQTVDESGQCKRKRRPVSAVFSSAIHRLSSSTSSVNPKRMSTMDASTPTREQIQHIQNQMRCNIVASPVPEEPRPSASTTTSTSSVASSSSGTSSSNGSTSSTATSPVPPQTSLIFDEKLGEWIYPIDQQLMSQLDNCSYFVGQPTRDSMVFNLMSQPEGAFVIRYSESKSKCLALSMRVPTSHNPAGISHYLIIRNEQGFRLKLSATKKPFPTLQMMLTHHSVIESHLPCTLHFVQWQKSNFKQTPIINSSFERPYLPTRTFNRHSTALTKIDENRNVAASSPYRTSNRCCDDFTTPKNRRSRHEINAIRRSHFFDDRQIVL